MPVKGLIICEIGKHKILTPPPPPKKKKKKKGEKMDKNRYVVLITRPNYSLYKY